MKKPLPTQNRNFGREGTALVPLITKIEIKRRSPDVTLLTTKEMQDIGMENFEEIGTKITYHTNHHPDRRPTEEYLAQIPVEHVYKPIVIRKGLDNINRVGDLYAITTTFYARKV